MLPLSQGSAEQNSTQHPELQELQLDTNWPIPQNFDLDFDFSAIVTDESSEPVCYNPFDRRLHQTEEKLPADLAYLNSRHEQLLNYKRREIAKSHEEILLAETESKCQVELAKLELERVKLRRAADKGKKI